MLFGSLLVFGGIVVLNWPKLVDIRNELYSDMLILFSDQNVEVVENVPITQDVATTVEDPVVEEPIDYSKYLGVLEIPRVHLKRGFYNTDNKYNDIKYNVMFLPGSDLPDVQNGNLILVAHSGTGYNSYFRYLYRLNIGDTASVTYNGNVYNYRIVNIYNVDKVGWVDVVRNESKTCLTLITCTKDDDNHQTIYVAELE
ncbi:MAG: sortase [Bacilli bacterium]|nr:sortase [Bacilli bacterium]